MKPTPRQPVKQDMRPILDRNAKGLIASVPKVNKNRDDIEQVAAYAPGHKGQQQKRRKSWPF
jgi:hypothetical protein